MRIDPDRARAHISGLEGENALLARRRLLQLALDLERIARDLHGILPSGAFDTDEPSLPDLRSICTFPREGVALLVKALMARPGHVVPDAILMEQLKCGRKTLVVYASHARRALRDVGYQISVSRARSRGYYIRAEVAEQISAASQFGHRDLEAFEITGH